MYCSFCGKPTGERSFCDEACYEEYQEDLKVWQESVKEDLPGEKYYYDDYYEPSDSYNAPW